MLKNIIDNIVFIGRRPCLSMKVYVSLVMLIGIVAVQEDDVNCPAKHNHETGKAKTRHQIRSNVSTRIVGGK